MPVRKWRRFFARTRASRLQSIKWRAGTTSYRVSSRRAVRRRLGARRSSCGGCKRMVQRLIRRPQGESPSRFAERRAQDPVSRTRNRSACPAHPKVVAWQRGPTLVSMNFVVSPWFPTVQFRGRIRVPPTWLASGAAIGTRSRPLTLCRPWSRESLDQDATGRFGSKVAVVRAVG